MRDGMLTIDHNIKTVDSYILCSLTLERLKLRYGGEKKDTSKLELTVS